jgi:hypothetical protein
LAVKRPPNKRRFRIVDLMVLVAATAVAFAIYRNGLRPGMTFTTLGTHAEAWLFFWMHQVTPFPAMWSIAVFAIDMFDSSKRRRREARHAGVIACCAATVVIAVSSLISSTFYVVHYFEEIQAIPKILSHGRQSHLPPPLGEAPLEAFVGAGILGAWSTLAVARRWRIEPTAIDRLGRVLGVVWIGLFMLYLYGYSG